MKFTTTTVNFSMGYGGSMKCTATLDGEPYVLELPYLETLLATMIDEKGYAVTQTKQQKYPRLLIND